MPLSGYILQEYQKYPKLTEVETIGIDTPQDLEHAERFLQARNAQ